LITQFSLVKYLGGTLTLRIKYRKQTIQGCKILSKIRHYMPQKTMYLSIIIVQNKAIKSISSGSPRALPHHTTLISRF